MERVYRVIDQIGYKLVQHNKLLTHLLNYEEKIYVIMYIAIEGLQSLYNVLSQNFDKEN